MTDFLTRYRFLIVSLLLWTFLIGLSLSWNRENIREQIMDRAYTEARANLNKDITFRRWGTSHGGVYVPVTETQQPVPWLAHIPDRDIVTASGKQLTLLNPASIVRQMMDRYAEDYGVRGRITGLVYLNPENKADAWEAQQIQSFERGESQEVWEIAEIEGSQYLRYLRVMMMEPVCMKCHAHLGFEVGDVRGATGLNLPLNSYFAQIDESHRVMNLSHVGIWGIGFLALTLSGMISVRRKQDLLDQQGQLEEQVRIRTEEIRQSNRKLEKAQQIARMGYWEIEKSTGREIWSQAVFDMFGIEYKSDFNIRSLLEMVHPDDRESLKAHLADSHEQQTDLDVEFRINHPDGSQRYIHALAESRVLKTGVDSEKLTGVLQDISEQKQTQDDLIKAREKMQDALTLQQVILDNAVAGMTMQIDRRFVWVNDFFCNMMGYQAKEIIGQSPTFILANPEDFDIIGKEAQEILPSGGIYQREAEYIRKDGSHIWCSFSGKAIDPNNLSRGVIYIIIDINENKKAADALLKAKESSDVAARVKSEFLANMSHEIRTPMNGIIGMAHLALQTELDEQQRNYVSKVHQSAEGLLGILNDILDFSKIESGKLELENIPLDIHEVMETVLQLVRLKAYEKDISLTSTIEEAVPQILMGDPLRLRQVFLNLASNAVKFTSAGGTVKLLVGLEEADEDEVLLHFKVEDSGIGLTAEEQESLFQAFSQADSSTSRRFGGTGLGLSISSKIVELMDGNIWVESQKDIGSCFHFTARLRRSGEGSLDAHALEFLSQQKVKRARESLNNRKVLLVEDNEINQELCLDLLLSQGMKVVSAYDGEEALEYLEDQDFDIVLMDCQMPGMDGYEATRRIRLQSRWDDLPILALTANVMKTDISKALDAGMNDHIGKPINPDTLFVTMADWMR